MILKGRTISRGYAEGNVVKLNRPLSFLGDVNISTGKIKSEKVEIQNKILVFPEGKGSTVGSFVIYNLKVCGKAPIAIINSSSEAIVATGAVISSIPMIDFVNIDLITNGDHVVVDANKGTVEIKNVEMKELVSSTVIVNKNIMLFKQPRWHDIYSKEWTFYTTTISKYESPEHAAIRGIKEKLDINILSFKEWPESIVTRKGQTIWNIHFFIFYTENLATNIKSKNRDLKCKLCSLTKTSMMNIDDKVLEVINKLSEL